MKTHEQKKTIGVIAALLMIIALTSLACSLGSLSISGDKATVEVNIPEDQINQWIDDAVVEFHDSSDEVFERVTKVEMHDGYLRVFGVTRDGAEGSFDVSISAENNELKVAIIAVDIPGWSMDDARVTRINQELQEGLDKSMADSHGEVRYLEATVTEESLMLKVETDLSQN